MGYEIGRGGLSAEWIKQNTGGKLIYLEDGKASEIFSGDGEAQILRGLSGNSRTLTPGEIFIANSLTDMIIYPGHLNPGHTRLCATEFPIS